MKSFALDELGELRVQRNELLAALNAMWTAHRYHPGNPNIQSRAHTLACETIARVEAAIARAEKEQE